METPSNPTSKANARALTSALFRAIWGVQAHGFERWQDVRGPAIVVANHLSLLDGPMLAAFTPVPLHYAVTGDFARRQPWQFLLDMLAATGHGSYTPLDPAKPLGMRHLHKALRDGRWVGIFPEGAISTTGRLGEIQPGVLRLAAATQATLLPVRISGAHQTVFGKLSRQEREALAGEPIELRAQPPIPYPGDEAAAMREIRRALEPTAFGAWGIASRHAA